MPYDPMLAMFGDDPEALKGFARVNALRGDVGNAQRLQRLGAVGALSSDEGLRGFGDNLYRTGIAQEEAHRRAMEESYEGLRQAHAKAAEGAEARRRWEAEMELRRQQAAAQQAYQRAQLGATYAGLDIRRQAAARAAEAAEAAMEAKATAIDIKKRAERQGIERSLSSAEENLRTIDQALEHPGRKAATGASGAVAAYLPYTKARDYQSVHNKLLGGAFLEAFSTLKGGGQITEMEGKKATDAITRLNTPGLTEGEYEDALYELRNVVTLSIERAKQQGYDIGMFQDLPGLPSGNPAMQSQQPGVFGMAPVSGRAQNYINRVTGGR